MKEMSPYLNCNGKAKDRVLHARITHIMEPADTFWNARFAMFSDKYGLNWMLNYEKDNTL